METASTRLFLALWPDAAVRDTLRDWRDAWAWPRGAKPVATDHLHLTLHFLGGVPRARLAALLEGLAAPVTPFTLQLGRPAAWHNGIAVLEPMQAPQPLLDLHTDLERALAAHGLVPEARAYRPHVTMARRAGGAAMPASGPAIDWHVERYALVESQGGVYTVLREYAAPA